MNDRTDRGEDDETHSKTCDWNLYPDDRDTDPHLCNSGCLARPDDIAREWSKLREGK